MGAPDNSQLPHTPLQKNPHPQNTKKTQTLNMLCVFAAEGKDSAAFKRHVGRLDDYLWVAEDGMKMQVGIWRVCCCLWLVY